MIELELSPGGGMAYIGSGAIGRLGEVCGEVFPGGRRALITDEALPREHVKAALLRLGEGTAILELPICEEKKDLEAVRSIYSFLYEEGFTRADGLVLLGGGVLLDTAGFAAATYLRGLGAVSVPTTLISQTDSAYGGTTGVTFESGKNHVGAFAQPKAVVCDTDFLRTLPERERISGMGEVITYGAIAEPSILGRVSRGLPDDGVIAECVKIKLGYTLKDERDTGERHILNFGHTVGHAFEAASGFTLGHGQAVAKGMLAAAWLGHELDVTEAGVLETLHDACGRAGLDTDWRRGLSCALPFIARDKKSDGRGIDLVLLKKLGQPVRRMTEVSLIFGLLKSAASE